MWSRTLPVANNEIVHFFRVWEKILNIIIEEAFHHLLLQFRPDWHNWNIFWSNMNNNEFCRELMTSHTVVHHHWHPCRHHVHLSRVSSYLKNRQRPGFKLCSSTSKSFKQPADQEAWGPMSNCMKLCWSFATFPTPTRLNKSVKPSTVGEKEKTMTVCKLCLKNL